MLDNFSGLQQIYLVSFSIFFAIMLDSVKSLAPFKTSTAFKEPKVFCRILISVGVLNALPIFYFWFTLTELKQISLSVLPIFVVFALSLGIYGFARLYSTVVIIWKNTLYTTTERDKYKNELRVLDRDWSQQFFPFLYYILFPFALFFWLKSDQKCLVVTLIILGFSIGIGLLFRWKRKDKLKDI